MGKTGHEYRALVIRLKTILDTHDPMGLRAIWRVFNDSFGEPSVDKEVYGDLAAEVFEVALLGQRSGS